MDSSSSRMKRGIGNWLLKKWYLYDQGKVLNKNLFLS